MIIILYGWYYLRDYLHSTVVLSKQFADLTAMVEGMLKLNSKNDVQQFNFSQTPNLHENKIRAIKNS